MITETKTRKLENGVTVVEISGRLNLGNSLLGIESGIKRLIETGARKLTIPEYFRRFISLHCNVGTCQH